MVIRMRHTRAHTRNRRSHHALTTPGLSACANCGAKTRPHHMCLACGFYKGRQVLDLAALKVRRDARLKATKDRVGTDAGTESAPQAAHDHAHEVAEQVAESEAPVKKARRVSKGTSAKKEKQEAS